MMKRITLLLLLTCCGGLIVSILYSLTINKQVQNGFERKFAQGELNLIAEIDINSNAYYFAGFNRSKLYLGISRMPFHLLEIQNSHQRIISIKGKFEPAIHASVISIDPPSFTLADIVSYTIFKGQLDSWKIDTVVQQRNFFSESITISPNSIILRSLNESRSEYRLSKETTWPFQITVAPALLQKQIDGLFCVDGMLQFDPSTSHIIYTYYYRNQFICTDTSLNLLYRGKTIDTVSQADIKVDSIGSMKSSTLSSPPKLVNRKSSCSNGKLFILSNLIADNEDNDTFQSSYAFDVYDIQTGHYDNSFYLPKIEGKRLRHFIVRNGELYVLCGTYLNIYKINFLKAK